jgi:hypothetical protein
VRLFRHFVAEDGESHGGHGGKRRTRRFFGIGRLACDVFWAVLDRDTENVVIAADGASRLGIRAARCSGHDRALPKTVRGQSANSKKPPCEPSPHRRLVTYQRKSQLINEHPKPPCPPSLSVSSVRLPIFRHEVPGQPCSKEPSRRARPYAPTPTRFLSPRRFFFSRSFPLSIFQRNGAVRLTLS